MNMNTFILPKTQHLVVFQEVIRSGSIGAAAKRLGISQPAVSKTISEMEDYFGIEVIIRKNTGVTLTSAGQVLLNYSESITREMKNMVSEINSLSCSSVADVAFGFPSLIGFTFLSQMIKTFKSVFPSAQVSMFEAQLSSFFPAIRDGRLDFAIGTLSDDMQLQDLHVEPLFDSEFVVVANKSRSGSGPLTLDALRHEQWVAPQTDMGYYKQLLSILNKHQIDTANIIKTDSVVTIYNLVLNANFLTVIPCDMTTPFGSNQFMTLAIEDAPPIAHYAAIWSKNYKIKKSALLLVELAKQYCPSQCAKYKQPVAAEQ